MGLNAYACSLVRQVEKTPGFSAKQLRDGTYLLTREPLRDLPARSVKFPLKTSDQSARNHAHRVRRALGWDFGLSAELEHVARRHRMAGTDPQGEIEQKLSAACELTKEKQL